MVGDRQSFGKKSAMETGNEEDAEMVLANAVPKPVKTHVQRLGHLEIDAVVGEAYGDLVITKYRGRRLGVAHVFQYFALVRGDASSSEDSGVLSTQLRRQRHRRREYGCSVKRWGG